MRVHAAFGICCRRARPDSGSAAENAIEIRGLLPAQPQTFGACCRHIRGLLPPKRPLYIDTDRKKHRGGRQGGLSAACHHLQCVAGTRSKSKTPKTWSRDRGSVARSRDTPIEVS